MSTFATSSMYETTDLNKDEQCLGITHFVIDGEDMDSCIIEVVNSEQQLSDTLQDGTQVFYIQHDDETDPTMLIQSSEEDQQLEQILLYQQLPESQPAIVVPQPVITDPCSEPDIENNSISLENTERELQISDTINQNLSAHCDSNDINIIDTSVHIVVNNEGNFDSSFCKSQYVDLKEMKVKKQRKPRTKLQITPQLHMRTRRKTLIEQNSQFCIVEHVKSKERVTREQNLQKVPIDVSSAIPHVRKKVAPVKASKKKHSGKSVDKCQPESLINEVTIDKSINADDCALMDMNELIEVDLYTQMSVLKEVDENKLSKSEIATKFNIALSCVSNIISNRTQIEDTYKNEYVNMLDLAPKSDLKVSNKDTLSLTMGQSETKSLLPNSCINVSFEMPFESKQKLGQRTRKCTVKKQLMDRSESLKVMKCALKSKKKNVIENIEQRDARRTRSHFTLKSLDSCTKIKIFEKVEKRELTKKEISEKYNITSPTLTAIMNESDNIEPIIVPEKPKKRKKRIEQPRQSYDIQTKLKIIAEVEKGKKKKNQVAKKFHVPKATLSTIVNSKEKVLDGAKKKTITCKRLRYPNESENNTNSRLITYNEDGTLKRATIDLFTKVEILKLVDSKTISKKAIAEKFNLATPTISCILKQRKNIENFSKLNNISKVKFRRSPHMEIEHRLCDYVRNENKLHPMTNTQICLQAVKIANELGYHSFKCHPSSAWIWRFKKRFNIVSTRTSDEERARVHKALEDKRKVKATGSFVCDICNLELLCASAMEKHLMHQHFPTHI